jgi:hypothetical protein
MPDMSLAYVVRSGEQPGNLGFETVDAACRAWSEARDNALMEVVETDLSGNELRRLSPPEIIARLSRSPIIR